MTASKNTINLRDILQRLNPNVPAGISDQSTPRHERNSIAIRQLMTYVSSDPMAKALLTGHIGVGKSTELLHLSREMKADRFVIQCSIAQTLGVHNVDVTALLILVLEASIGAWIERLGDLPPGLVEELSEHASKLLPKTRKQIGKPKPSFGTDVELALRDLLKRFPEEVTTGRQLHRLYGQVLQRLALRYVPTEHIITLDPGAVALSCEVLLKEIENKSGHTVLLVIDDLDKVRDETAQSDIFIDRAMAWIRLPCSVVATLPLDFLFSSRGRELDNVWGEVQILDPLPVPDLGTTAGFDDPTLQPYLAILRMAGAQSVISAFQVRKLAHAANGLPRSFIYSCGACIRYALEAQEEHVRDYHIELVLRDLTDRWRGRLSDSDYKSLVLVLDSGGSNVPRAARLIRDGILIRDGSAPSEKQFRLASWAEPLVESYRKRKTLHLTGPEKSNDTV